MAKAHTVDMPTMRRLQQALVDIEQLKERVDSIPKPKDRDRNQGWIAVIDNPPAGDYTDNRYWVRRCYIGNSAQDDENAEASVRPFGFEHPSARRVTATNLAERESQTHSLDNGVAVIVYNRIDANNKPRFYFSHGGGSSGMRFVIVRDVGNGLGRTVQIQFVTPDENAPLVRYNLDRDANDQAKPMEPANCWPMLLARDYVPFVVGVDFAGDFIEPVSPASPHVLPAVNLHGAWYVQQFWRIPYEPRAADIQTNPLSDCWPWWNAIGRTNYSQQTAGDQWLGSL